MSANGLSTFDNSGQFARNRFSIGFNFHSASSRGKFSLQLDLADAGKKMYGFAHWKNTADETKSGPWISFSALVNDYRPPR